MKGIMKDFLFFTVGKINVKTFSHYIPGQIFKFPSICQKSSAFMIY